MLNGKEGNPVSVATDYLQKNVHLKKWSRRQVVSGLLGLTVSSTVKATEASNALPPLVTNAVSLTGLGTAVSAATRSEYPTIVGSSYGVYYLLAQAALTAPQPIEIIKALNNLCPNQAENHPDNPMYLNIK